MARMRRFATERDVVDRRTGKKLTISIGYHGKTSFKVGNHVAVLTSRQAKELRTWLNEVSAYETQ